MTQLYDQIVTLFPSSLKLYGVIAGNPITGLGSRIEVDYPYYLTKSNITWQIVSVDVYNLTGKSYTTKTGGNYWNNDTDGTKYSLAGNQLESTNLWTSESSSTLGAMVRVTFNLSYS